MTTSRNDITGDKLSTKVPSKEFLNNYDRIFATKKLQEQKDDVDCGCTGCACEADAYKKTISE